MGIYIQSKKPNIFLFATRRGGSSIISEILNSDKNMREIDQPFDLFHDKTEFDRLKREVLPNKYLSQFIELNNEEKKQVHEYIKNITTGKFNKIQSFTFANRTVLKIVNANPLIKEITDNHNCIPILLLRHPITQAQSILRNKWGFTNEAYTRSNWFIDNFDTEIRSYINTIQTKGSNFSKAILNWCFENYTGLKAAKENSVNTVFYEHIISDPKTEITKLCNIAIIRNVEIAINKIYQPSRSSQFSDNMTIKSIKSNDKKSLIENHFEKIDKSDLDSAEEILQLFKIIPYSAYSPYPLKKYTKPTSL